MSSRLEDWVEDHRGAISRLYMRLGWLCLLPVLLGYEPAVVGALGFSISSVALHHYDPPHRPVGSEDFRE